MYDDNCALRQTFGAQLTSDIVVSEKPARLCLKCDGTRAKTIFRLSAKRTSPLKGAGASVQSTTGIRGVRISGSNGSFMSLQVFG